MDNSESNAYTPHHVEENEKGKNAENAKLYKLEGLTAEDLFKISVGLDLLHQDYLNQIREASDAFKAELDQERKETLVPLMDKVDASIPSLTEEEYLAENPDLF